jgi:NAD(P)H-dependent FMN reductase
MHYFILAGSHRPEAQSTKVAHRIEQAMGKLAPEDTSFVYDLRTNPLPLWNDWMWDQDSDEYKAFLPLWQPIVDEMNKADAFVIISPEWSGMATPGVKNFFLFCSAENMGNKPALLVSVSAGRGGRYPISELRSSSYKNTQLCYIPQHVIVDHVSSVLNTPELESEDTADGYIKTRLQYSLGLLREYAKGLQIVRTSGVQDFEKFGNGM